MNSVFLDIVILLAIFVTSSVGSGWMMHRLGYGLPGRLKGRDAAILVVMKILLMSVWAIVLIVLLWLMGINPLHI